jgi:predicted transcriptional regulator
MGASPIFHMQPFGAPTHLSLVFYAIIGLICGLASVVATKALFMVEDIFEKYVPVHWMWWPAIGAVVVGICGILDASSMGVGYDHISAILSAHWALTAVIMLLVFKWISWTIALGSGTSGGTLAPLFMLGGALGFLLGTAITHLIPDAGVNVRVAALVGMAALFAGASRAFLTSVVFAFETTLQPHGLLPLLIGSVLAFWVSCVLMPDSSMTEKITRRGVTVPTNYLASPLDRLKARDALQRKVPTIRADQTVAEAKKLAAGSKGGEKGYWVVVDGANHALGIVDWNALTKPELKEDAAVGSLPLTQVPVLKADHSLRVASRIVVDATPHAVIVMDTGASRAALGVLTPEDILKTTSENR